MAKATVTDIITSRSKKLEKALGDIFSASRKEAGRTNKETAELVDNFISYNTIRAIDQADDASPSIDSVVARAHAEGFELKMQLVKVKGKETTIIQVN